MADRLSVSVWGTSGSSLSDQTSCSESVPGAWYLVSGARCPVSSGSSLSTSHSKPGSQCPVPGAWCLELGAWCLDPGAWRRSEPGAWCPVSGARCAWLTRWPASGAQCPAAGAWCPMPGARCPVPGAWRRSEPGAWHRSEPCAWCLAFGARGPVISSPGLSVTCICVISTGGDRGGCGPTRGELLRHSFGRGGVVNARCPGPRKLLGATSRSLARRARGH